MTKISISLTRVVWLHLIGLRGVVILFLTILTSWGGLFPAGFWVLLMADLAFLFWQTRVLQASADEYVRAYGGLSRVWGSYLLCLLVIFGSASAWWGLYLASFHEPPEENFAEKMDRFHAELYDLSVSEDGQTLRFTGTITHGLTKALGTVLDTNPRLRTVELRSDGGHVYEARGSAKLVRDAGLSTVAIGSCMSTCTLLFIAGSKRQVSRDGRLGFHQYAILGDEPILNVDPVIEQAKDAEFFRSQGVSDSFVEQMFKRPSDQMWFPQTAFLARHGVLTEAP